MKKTIIAVAIATAALSSHANFVSVDVDSVKDDRTGAVSHAQYFRAAKDFSGTTVGLQVRTATFSGGGMVNSVEGTLGRQVGPLGVFGGIGHDNGFNGGRSFQYGLVGASTGMKIGPFWGYLGAKTRVNWDSNNPKQTVAFAGLSKSLTKELSVNVGMSKSYQDFKETAWGAGVRVSF